MDVKQLLREKDFHFNKQFGQNFLTDKQLLQDITQDANANGSVMLEIGAGAGTLTRELAICAKRVVSFEIDRNLKQILDVTLADCANVQVVIGDVMKYTMPQIEQLCAEPYNVVANIPYYLTSPLIMRFVEQAQNVLSLTLTIQKEVAERLCAHSGTKEYGAITVAVDAVADVTTTRVLPRQLFYPQPNVDSAVVHIAINRNKYQIDNHDLFRKTIRTAFAMRRKTLVNNLINGFGISRQDAESLLASCNLEVNCRGEQLTTAQFVQLYKQIESNGLR